MNDLEKTSDTKVNDLEKTVDRKVTDFENTDDGKLVTMEKKINNLQSQRPGPVRVVSESTGRIKLLWNYQVPIRDSRKQKRVLDNEMAVELIGVKRRSSRDTRNHASQPQEQL